jgi:hypothetical protein
LLVEQPPIANGATPTAAAPANATPPAPERSAAVDAAAPTPKAEALATFDILVVDAATQHPVADAEAFWSDATAYERLKQLKTDDSQVLLRNPEALAQRFGQRGRSDRDGHLRVAIGREQVALFCRAGDRFGELTIDGLAPPPADGHRLLLLADEKLVVRVLDALGVPAPAVVVALSPRGIGPAELVRMYTKFATSDDGGLVTFPHLQRLRTNRLGPHREDAITAFAVSAVLAGREFATAVVDPQGTLPTSPIEIRLPPTGSLSVRALVGGAPLPIGEAIKAFAGATSEIGTGSYLGSDQTKLAVDGSAMLSWLPIDMPLQLKLVGAQTPPLGIAGVQQREIEFSQEALVVRGRVLDDKGQPLAATFAVRHTSDHGGGAGVLQTDAEGRFCYFLANRKPGTVAQLTKFELEDHDRPDRRIALPPRPLHLGVNELGDLQLGGEPLLCGGRLVGGGGEFSRVQLVVERMAADELSSSPTWRTLPRPRVGIDKNGAFAARGVVEPGRYRLRVMARDFLPVTPLEFRLGQDDLVVPLRAGHPLAIACRLTEAAPLHALDLDLVEASTSFDAASLASFDSRLDHRRGKVERGQSTFRWWAVEAGTYTLRVSLFGWPEPLLEIPNVVLPQPDQGDPRLAPLDLAAVLRTIALRFEIAGGPLKTRRAFALWEPAPATGPRPGFPIESKDAWLLLPRATQSLCFVAEGHRPRVVSIPTDVASLDVKLQPWAHVELQLAAGTQLPPGCELAVRVASEPVSAAASVAVSTWSGRREYGGLFEPDSVQAVFRKDRDRVASLPIGEGRRTLRFMLLSGNRQHSLQRATPNEVVAGAPVTITLDADELAAAAATLAAPAKAK